MQAEKRFKYNVLLHLMLNNKGKGLHKKMLGNLLLFQILQTSCTRIIAMLLDKDRKFLNFFVSTEFVQLLL